MLRAPNGKMYVASNERFAISIINDPDAITTPAMTIAQRQAAIGWSLEGQSLISSRRSYLGLPQMVARYTPTNLIY